MDIKIPLLNSIIIFLILHQVHCHKDGAPSEVCQSMTPGHFQKPQTTPFPYTITVARNPVVNEQPVTIIINGTDFKGFLVMVQRSPGDGNENEDNGELEMHPEYPKGVAKRLECNNNNHGLTHTGPEKKRELVLQWSPPDDDGDFVILATIVRDFNTYWVKQSSKIIKVRRHVPSGSGSGSGRSLDPIPVKPMGDDAHTPIFKKVYEHCGKTKGCFGLPAGCVGTGACEMLTTFYTPKDNKNGQYMTFELTGRLPKAGSTEGHVSVGFSADAKMGADSVVGCVLQNGLAVAKSYYNLPNDTQNSIMKNKHDGLLSYKTAIYGSYSGGFVFCEFNKSFEQKSPGEIGQNFELDHHPYYLFLARASNMDNYTKTGAEKLGYHRDMNLDKGVSPFPVTLVNYKGVFSGAEKLSFSILSKITMLLLAYLVSSFH